MQQRDAQLDLQSLHRARDRLVGERTALIDQLRAFLPERGIAVPKGRRGLELRLEEVLAPEQASLSPRTRLLIEDMRAEWRELDRRILASTTSSPPGRAPTRPPACR